MELLELVKECLEEELVKTHLVDLNKLKVGRSLLWKKHLFDPSRKEGATRRKTSTRIFSCEFFLSLSFIFLFLCVYFSLFFLFSYI